jgi:outer membrane protein assembly factor BamB
MVFRPIALSGLPAARMVSVFLAVLVAAPAGPPNDPPPPTAAANLPVDPIEGVWTGTVTAPQGTVADISFEFVRTPQGPLIFRISFSEMFTYGVTFGIPVEANGRGDYAITPAFATRLHLDGATLTGTFASARLPLSLHRGGHLANRPPPPIHPPAPAPLWRRPLGSPTWAPPAVEEGVVFVGTEAGVMHAVRATDGTGLWTWAGANRIDGRAVVSRDSVFFVDGKVNLVALARATGTLRWIRPLHDGQIAGGPPPDNPTFNHRCATPLLLDGVLYVGSSDGGLYAIDALTGEKRWRHEAQAPVFSGVGFHGSDTLLFGTMDGSVVLLDRRTRRETLRVKTGGGVVTTPVVAGDILVVGSRDYVLHGFNLTDGSLAWRFSYWFSWIESTPVLVDGLLYVGASDFSRVSAIDPATGRARWSAPVHGMNWGTPLVTNNRVFTGTVNQNLPGTAIEHTAGLVALDRATGAVVWALALPKAAEGNFAGYAGSLALAGDKIIAAGFDGELAAFPAQ